MTIIASSSSFLDSEKRKADGIAVCYLMVGLTLIGICFPELRYLQYLTPFFSLAVLCFTGKIVITRLCMPYLAILLFGLLLSPLSDEDGFKDLFFIFSGISASIVVAKARLNIKILLTMLYFCLFYNAVAHNGLLNTGLIYDFGHSDSSFEGNFGFVFGIVALYCLFKGYKLYYLLSLFAVFLDMKRIVIGATLLCSMVYLLRAKIKVDVVNWISMLLVNISVLAVLVLYGNNNLDDLINLITGQSANEFGMGRQEIYSVVVGNILDNPLKYLFMGSGPGAGYEILDYFSATNLHSDVLKIFYEYGLVLFVLVMYLGYKSKNICLKILFLYVNIIFITDNALIYHYFIFFICLFSRMIEEDYVQYKR